MFVSSKRSERDLFWGLYNKKGAWYFGGTKVRQQKVLQGAKPEVYIECMDQIANAVYR